MLPPWTVVAPVVLPVTVAPVPAVPKFDCAAPWDEAVKALPLADSTVNVPALVDHTDDAAAVIVSAPAVVVVNESGPDATVSVKLPVPGPVICLAAVPEKDTLLPKAVLPPMVSNPAPVVIGPLLVVCNDSVCPEPKSHVEFAAPVKVSAAPEFSVMAFAPSEEMLTAALLADGPVTWIMLELLADWTSKMSVVGVANEVCLIVTLLIFVVG